jgi:hypothetical protein
MLKSLSTILVAAALMAGCSPITQTSSGRAYLENYPAAAELAVQKTGKADNAYALHDIDQEVQQVAAIEPQLRLPARIGLAKIDNGRLAQIPAAEVIAWRNGAKRLGANFGEFVPVSPLIAEIVAGFGRKSRCERNGNNCYADSLLFDTVRKIRLGAARQHLDAVLIYESFGVSHQKGNALSTLNFTIIGAFALPGEDISVRAIASALLIDVRNGYPYGTVSKSLETDKITPSAGSRAARLAEERATRAEAILALVPEVEKMFRKLRPELAALDQPKN